jgi:CheY-like chemotaxis protein
MRGRSLRRRLTLVTGLDPRASRVVLEVADTGPGIPPEIRSRIFEPFFTTKPPGEGTGLGLPLCHGIVEGHGGSIEAGEAPGGGAVFRVELPVVSPPPPHAETDPALARSSNGSGRVLVVDDEPQIADLLADVLTADGLRVETAGSGRSALAKLREGGYDVVLSDMKMPELDGPGLYREVRRHDPRLARRFVFLTGDGLGPETRQFLDQVEARLSVSKPFDLAEVRRVVHRALRR